MMLLPLLIFFTLISFFSSSFGASDEDSIKTDRPKSAYGFIDPSPKGIVNSYYLEVRKDIDNGKPHTGIDLACANPDPVLAVSDGVIKQVYTDEAGGNTIIMKSTASDEEVNVMYIHHDRSLVKAGQAVLQGQQIAVCGKTGVATGDHIHLEIEVNKERVDPLKYLPINGK